MLSDNLIKKFATTRAERIAKNMDTIISFNDVNLDDLDEKDAGELLLKNLDIRGQDEKQASSTLSHKNQLKSVLKKEGNQQKTALSRSIIELLGTDDTSKKNVKAPITVTLEVPDVVTKKKVKTIHLKKEKSSTVKSENGINGTSTHEELDLEDEELGLEDEENESIHLNEEMSIDLVEEKIEFMKRDKVDKRDRELSVMSIPPPPEELDLDEFTLPETPSQLDTNKEEPSVPLVVDPPSERKSGLPDALKHLLSQDANKLDSFSDIPQVTSYMELPINGTNEEDE